MKNKYITKNLLSFLVILAPLFGYTQNSALNETVDRAVLSQTAHVKVQVKFIKPIRMSDVMFRRPRGKNVVIDVKHKEKRCNGRLSSHMSRVYVPTACVQEDTYHISQVKLTFANGREIQAAKKDVKIGKDGAFVAFRLK